MPRTPRRPVSCLLVRLVGRGGGRGPRSVLTSCLAVWLGFGTPCRAQAQSLEPPPVALDRAPPPPRAPGDDDDLPLTPPSWVNDPPDAEAADRGSAWGDVDAPRTLRRDPASLPTVGEPLEGNTVSGAVGVLRVLSASTAPAGRLRLQFTGEFSSAHSMVVRRDQNTRLAGTLAGAYVLRRGIELFGAFLSSSNKNRRLCSGGVCESEPDRVDPEVIRAFGDLVVGAKFARSPQPGWSVAAYTSLKFFSSTEGVFFDLGATSLTLGGAATWDMSRSSVSAKGRVPLRFHGNLGYYVDRSTNLQDFSGASQSSQLVASYAYGMGRSRLQAALAVETLGMPLGRNAQIAPFAEYHFGWVTGRANEAFADFAEPLCSSLGRPCQDNRDQQAVGFGARATFASWSATGAVDLGFRSVGFPYGPPQAPYSFALQIGRAFDLGSRGFLVRQTPAMPSIAPTEDEPVDTGVVTGRIVGPEGTPVSLAVIAVQGLARAKVASDPDGSFTSHELEPGVVDLLVTAEGFLPQSVRARVKAGMATEVQVSLEPAVNATVRGRVLDATGKGLAARVHFSGTADVAVATDSAGAFEAPLPPGVYVARAVAEGFLTKEQRLSLETETEVDFTLRPRREVAAASYTPADGLNVRLPLSFDAQAGGLPVVLSARSYQTLDEVVDILVTQPRIRTLVIETHWDVSAGRADPKAITEQQAHAIADYLQAQGIAADRLQLAPMGASAPLVPNVGPGRVKNRRVVLKALEG